MDIQGLLPYWPYALIGVAALTIVASVGVLVVIYHKSLVNAVKHLIGGINKNIFNRETLYWTVNITFMAFSAYHAAPFYASVSVNILGMDWFAPFVGITAALTLDALVIVFQNARKRASYKHDRKRERMYMRYIAACCGMNSVANIYTNYQHFDVSKYTDFWWWALDIAPVFLSLFPLFIMGMSNALEEMSSSSALDTLDVAAFKKDEEKRVGLLEAQATFQDREVKADRRLIEIERQRKENERLRKGKAPKQKQVSRLAAWWWKIPAQDDVVKALEQATLDHQEALKNATLDHQKIVADLQTKYDDQIVALTEQIALLSSTLETLQTSNTHRRSSVAKYNAGIDAQALQSTTQVSTPERQTDEMPIVDNSNANSDTSIKQKRPTPLFGRRNENPALRKVRSILKKSPELGPTEIGKKAGISRSYASQLRDQIMKESVAG